MKTYRITYYHAASAVIQAENEEDAYTRIPEDGWEEDTTGSDCQELTTETEQVPRIL